MCLHRDHIYTVDIETADTEEIFFSKVSSVLPLITWQQTKPASLRRDVWLL